MDFELHAPSMGEAATSLIVAMLALICGRQAVRSRNSCVAASLFWKISPAR